MVCVGNICRSPLAEGIMKQNGFADCQTHRRRMRTDFFKLSYVVFIAVFRSHQCPDLRYLIFFDVQHARAFRRVKPFVQRSSKIITLQIVTFEIKLRK